MRLLGSAIAALILLSRLCHARVVWVEEAYPMLGALQMLDGRLPYRDFWYDKPPLVPLFYLLCGAQSGWPLRLLDSAFCLAACWFAYRAASRLWSQRAACAAAALLAFFFVFDHHSVVMAIAPDAFLVLTSLAAISFAASGQGVAAGFACALGVAANVKGVLMIPVCVAFAPAQWSRIALGASPAALLLLLPGFFEQVILWGRVYSGDTFVANPLREGVTRSAGWLAFHAALVVAGWRAIDRRFALWIALMVVSVTLGLRFSPRYYFAMLPPFVLLAARGWELSSARMRYALMALLLIPAVRFGPRYAQLAMDTPWADLALFEDARAAAAHVRGPVFVWGYRPEINVLARRPARDFYIESQPLTGVFADRHLTSAKPSAAPRPWTGPQSDYVVDGLGPLNPALAIPRDYLRGYTEIARTKTTIIYRSNKASASRETP